MEDKTELKNGKKDELLENNVNEITINKKTTIDELLIVLDVITKGTKIIENSKKVEEIKSLFYIKIKEKETKKEDEKIEGKTSDEQLFKEKLNLYKLKKKNIRSEILKEEKVNLKIKTELIDEIKDLIDKANLKKETFDKIKDIQKRWRNTGFVNISERNNIWHLYNFNIELFYDCIQINRDFRNLDFKKNLEEKNKICKLAENLLKEKSIKKMHSGLQELHDKWKNIGPVSKENREIIWLEFQTISKRINKKQNDYFTQLKNQEKAKIDSKNLICKKINDLSEKITSHKECQAAIKEIKELEKDWLKIGKISSIENKKCWKNLNEAKSKFNVSKNNYYKSQKIELKKIIERKQEICAKAKALKSNTNWKEATVKFINLQKSWEKEKTNNSTKINPIWKEFRSNCNEFFEAKKLYFKKLDIVKNESLKSKKIILDELKKLTIKNTTKEILNSFDEKWNKIGALPKGNENLILEFEKILLKLYSSIKIDTKELTKIKYKRKINHISKNPNDLIKEKEKIKGLINDNEKVVGQYENNKSFIVVTKKENPLLIQIEKNINNVANEIIELKEKLRFLNSL